MRPTVIPLARLVENNQRLTLVMCTQPLLDGLQSRCTAALRRLPGIVKRVSQEPPAQSCGTGLQKRLRRRWMPGPFIEVYGLVRAQQSLPP